MNIDQYYSEIYFSRKKIYVNELILIKFLK